MGPHLRDRRRGHPLTRQRAPSRSASWGSHHGPRRGPARPASPGSPRPGSRPRTRTCTTSSILGVGELVYGLGERFGPLVKNGQASTLERRRRTSSEQAYKNVPFTSPTAGTACSSTTRARVVRGRLEAVERVQFSVPGETLEYLVIGGPRRRGPRALHATPGRPARVPAWSYGLWLTTCFTTDYDEETVNGFVDGMAERDIPLAVFHFDCFWMRGFQWTDFEWDPRRFPDPEGMLARLHERGLRVCAWINPYIAQRSRAVRRGGRRGYLVRRADGSVWQWDMWQAGMGLVDFTNPAATTGSRSKLRALLVRGSTRSRPTSASASPPTSSGTTAATGGACTTSTRSCTTRRSSTCSRRCAGRAKRAVRPLRDDRRPGCRCTGAVTTTSTYDSMAETLRGGLSLALGGFGFWSHDIGGFEGSPMPACSSAGSRSACCPGTRRLHGSRTYRVPWAFDDGRGAEGEAWRSPGGSRSSSCALMPYLSRPGWRRTRTGTPVHAADGLEFPDDRASSTSTASTCSAPTCWSRRLQRRRHVEYYLPAGRGRTGSPVRWSTAGAGEREARLHSLPL